MPAVFADDHIDLLADAGTLVCPYCGGPARSEVESTTTFTETIFSWCLNNDDGSCNYSRKVTRIKGLGIEIDSAQGGSAINPSIVDGNAYWNVPADEIETNPYFTSPGNCVIGPRGYYRYYCTSIDYGSLSSYASYDGTYYSISIPSSTSITYIIVGYSNGYLSKHFFKSVPSGLFQFGYEVHSSSIDNVTFTVKSSTNFSMTRSYGIDFYAGNPFSFGSDFCADVPIISGLEFSTNRILSTSNSYYGFLGDIVPFVELVSDSYGNPYDFSVTNNNYINVENKTITVNNQEINYNNAYFQNNAYYIYQADGGVSTYITDVSGKIIGACIYQADTNSYQIVLFGNYTEDDLPDDSGSSGDNNGGSGGSGGSSGGSDDSDSGGGWLSNLFQDLLKKLFEGIVDGLLAVLKAALGIILKLLTSLFLLIPQFSKALSYVFPFIHLSVLNVMTAGFALLLILAIVKFIRGFF